MEHGFGTDQQSNLVCRKLIRRTCGHHRHLVETHPCRLCDIFMEARHALANECHLRQ